MKLPTATVAETIVPSNISVTWLVPKILETFVCFAMDKTDMSRQVPKKITKSPTKIGFKGRTAGNYVMMNLMQNDKGSCSKQELIASKIFSLLNFGHSWPKLPKL